MADSSLKTLNDLRSGRTPWQANGAAPDRDYPAHITCDVVIVGAGITGAFLAERLTRRGLRVVVLDRHMPERASTAASTALLLWELDTPLRDLEDRLGFETASSIYRRSVQGVQAIAALVSRYAIACDFIARDSLFLAGDKLDPADLREEERLRRMAGLDSRYLAAGAVESCGFRAEGALRSGGSAEADPVALARGLMTLAQQRGAALLSPMTAVAYDATVSGVAVATDRGTQIVSAALVLATGYDMPEFVKAPSHRLFSTWALASNPLLPQSLWPDRCLVWEASDPYLYLRSMADGRLVVGGADEEIVDAAAREALMPAKAAEILRRLAARFRQFDRTDIAYAWSGLFGVTDDGLPLIGRVPGMAHCYAAFGYGGNGITFSAIAADIIDRLLRGEHGADMDSFALDRQG